MPFDHLNDDAYWKTLFDRFIPKFKKKKAELEQKKFLKGVEQKAHEPIPCKVCGKGFDGYNGFGVPKKPYCPSCQKFFDLGCVCFVTIAGEWSFVSFPGADRNQIEQLRDKMFTVDDKRMKEIKAALKTTPHKNTPGISEDVQNN